jgi:DNA repair protein SbcC/Rad50
VRLTRLEMSGFGAFRDATIIDFSDVDFFALTGPTGSGKSTVIDAVCFALYGSVPRYENKALIRYVVTLGASEAKTALTFELEGTTYIAARVVRRSAKGQVTTKEARLERVEPDGSTTSLAGTEREMTPAVANLLQLDFNDFTRCVVLPQGEFASFLRAKGAERRDLLIKLLNLGMYEAVGSRSGQRAETARSSAELRRRRLDDLAFASDANLKEATKHAAAIRKIAGRTEKARPKIQKSLDSAQEEARRETEARELVTYLRKIAVPDEVRKYGAALATAQGELEMARSALKEAGESRGVAETATEGLPDLLVLQGILDAHGDLSRCLRNLESSKSDAEVAAKVEADTLAALERVEKEFEIAQTELTALVAAHQAEHLAMQLAIGEPCPVCRQVVSALPKHHAPKALTAARRGEASVKKAVDAARGASESARQSVTETSTRIRTYEEQRMALETRVASYPDSVALTPLIDEIKEKAVALDSARRAQDQALRLEQDKRREIEALRSKGVKLETKFGAQRDSVVALKPPAPGHRDLLADWQSLATWAADAITAQMEVGEQAAKAKVDHEEFANLETLGLIDECQEVGVVAAGDIVAVIAALSEASALAKVEVERISEAMEEVKELGEKVRALEEEAAVASQLRNLLRANNFPEWLIAEALEILVLEASQTLRALTNDGFSLTLGEQEFMVIDHANADELRSARTLSGGETFQASLALALALSDQIRSLAAEGAPMLDALFLDEGFGTLDSETLDTVASTIENLGQSGRMVGIITHVRELAERVPVRFEVRKGPRTSTIERLAS